MNKHELRKKYKDLRANLTTTEIDEKSLAIANMILKLPIWDKAYYHLFLSIKEQNEINTDYILQILAGKDKEIVVSKSDFATLEMTHYLLTESTNFRKNEYNISEPSNGVEVAVNKIEVVFIPLLAFDLKGNRVGYGKGFYDKFLAKCNPEIKKVGLSFFEAEDEINGTYEKDILLDYCVTPNKIYSF